MQEIGEQPSWKSFCDLERALVVADAMGQMCSGALGYVMASTHKDEADAKAQLEPVLVTLVEMVMGHAQALRPDWAKARGVNA